MSSDWKRADKLVLIGLILGALGAAGNWASVPEFRPWIKSILSTLSSPALKRTLRRSFFPNLPDSEEALLSGIWKWENMTNREGKQYFVEFGSNSKLGIRSGAEGEFSWNDENSWVHGEDNSVHITVKYRDGMRVEFDFTPNKDKLEGTYHGFIEDKKPVEGYAIFTRM
jgi:hypothetical protein